MTTTTKGAFSGTLTYGSRIYALRGQFDIYGHAHTSVPRVGMNPITIDLHLDLTNGTTQITGTCGDGTWLADMLGYRSVFNALKNPCPWRGRYTLALAGPDMSTNEPCGVGYGTILVDRSGQAHFSGSLGDGTAANLTAPISKNGEWPLFIRLYANRGCLWSWLTFTNTPDTDIDGVATWIKPAITGSSFYPNGFTMDIAATGSTYTRPPTGHSVLDIASAAVTFDNGNLTTPITNYVTLRPNGTVQNWSTNGLSLTVALGTGGFSGTVVSTADHRRLPFRGVVLQKQNYAEGIFLGTNQTGCVSLRSANLP